MNESTRLAYLDRMGITVWCARQGSSIGYESAVATIEHEHLPVQEVESTVPRLAGKASQRSEVDSGKAPVSKPIERTAPPIAAFSSAESIDSAPSVLIKNLDQDTALTPPVQFCFIRAILSNGYLLLAQASNFTAEDLSIPESRLLSAIILALGLQVEEVETGARQGVSWPQSSGLTSVTGMKEAREFVAAYLESQLRRTKARGLLLLGHKLDALCLGDVQAPTIKSQSINVIRGESLNSLLLDPSKKAALWHSIKHLRT